MDFDNSRLKNLYHRSVKALNFSIVKRIANLIVLLTLIFLELNMNFLHRKVSSNIKEEIQYRVKEQFKLYEFDNILNLRDLLRKSIEKSKTMKDSRFLFKTDRFNIHFLSNKNLKNVEPILQKLDKRTKLEKINIKSKNLNKQMQIEEYHAKYELIVRTQSDTFLIDNNDNFDLSRFICAPIFLTESKTAQALA